MTKVNLVLFFILLITSGCKKDSPTEPQPSKPPGYQEDIPWPSLADSPWPMYRADPQNTGRSKYRGPLSVTSVSKIRVNEMEAGVAIGKDSTIYFISKLDYKLYAKTINGDTLWSAGGMLSASTSPLITKEGNIVAANSKKIMMFDRYGSLIWEYISSNRIHLVGLNIGLEGTIYFTDAGQNLCALYKNGEIKWKITDSEFSYYTSTVLSFSPDGKTLYFQGINSSIIAVDIENQSIKWKYGDKVLKSGALIDTRGNIYIVPSAFLYSLNPDGSLRWKYQLDSLAPNPSNSEPTMDKNGNLYFARRSLYSLDYEGKLRWKYVFPSNYSLSSPLICDNNNNIFLAADADGEIKVMAFSAEGNRLWETSITGERSSGSSPALLADGILVVPTFRSEHLIIIK